MPTNPSNSFRGHVQLNGKLPKWVSNSSKTCMHYPLCDQKAERGCLYIVATPIGNLADISTRAISILSSVDYIACEDTRVTSKLLAHLQLRIPLLPYHDKNESQQMPKLLCLLEEGKSVALVSDAGTPCISDPGFRIVRECRKNNVHVVPIPGPSAAIAALSVSGFPSNGFLFAGFLPPKSSARCRFFQEYADFPFSIILYESSHRIEKCLYDLHQILGDDRYVFLARELTKLHETFLVGPLATLLQNFDNQSHKGEFTLIISPANFQL